mmetsp:Transcript_10548/g.13365  ORF Transcript_10548/g.13365 Transcript_10548/m.13365 type:complete len:476 (+) Transcript_10548:140-1567(+)
MKQQQSSSNKLQLLKNPLQKKGLLTVLLIILGESITLSNAVQFWSTYQSWSERYGRGSRRFHQNQQQQNQEEESDIPSKLGAFSSFSSSVHECSVTTSGKDKNLHCVSDSDATLPAKLHPRQIARIANTVSSLTTATTCENVCTDAMYNCCKTSCPSCLDIRGGHSHVTTDATAAAAAALAITPYGLSLNVWKVIFQIFLTALNVACWYIPLKTKKITENKLGLGIANAFSGGVFLSLAFGHLIPECVHGFEGKGLNEALPFMIVLGGYLLIFFVEKVAFDAHGLMHEVDHDEHGHSHGKKEVVKSNGSEDDVGDSGGTPFNGRSAVILLGALAVHSILEMTALGLANSFGDSALLSLSIALHQPAESIALLVAFLKSGMPKPDIIKFLSIFSACGPIGVAIGMAVNEFAAPIIDSIMLATVAGTFIYVGATEVIPEEWEDQEHKWKKFFALISGIVSIFAITQYTMTLEGHSHS